MTILVTGAAGLLGRVATRLLIERGETVIAGDLVRPDLGNLDVAWAQLDVTDLRKVFSLCEAQKVTRVLHLSGLVSTRAYNAPYETLEVNVMGLANLLEAARIFAMERLVYASSVALYGLGSHYQGPVDEDAPYLAMHLYGATKIMNEGTAKQYGRLYGVNATGLRPQISFGKDKQDGGAGIFNEFIRACATDKPSEWRRIFKEGTKIRPIYAEDAGGAFVHALLGPPLPSPVYNIGGQDNLTEDEWVSRVLVLTGSEALPAVPAGPQFDLDTPDIDCSRFVAESGFQHRFTLDEALQDIITHHRNAS
ncbi:NAD-dependent epimerase/dehydratase family protein [Novosphingobium sp. JCM 18896]|uniref:NAD-dependent epimerase/dehydratase family protein n=1 Tax=Novosphingobium sp. JCM 18896 TaxID=2989731 RepID=UPI002221417F|nr:NAD(P)-dependent oxidoreductase [Novosphingobium sp. JCM 18896]MCW1432312.1 NAD(P)-dependent oxidoreductase [Novosphingobium sp. JCM 18896]